MNSHFYLQANKNADNRNLVEQIEAWSISLAQQVYLIDKPLGDSKYEYTFATGFVLLAPKHKITFINYGDDDEEFQTYVDDFIEDLGSISDKFRYKSAIGRPRDWADLIHIVTYRPGQFNAETLFDQIQITGPGRQRICELLISLLTGSINDIDKVRETLPDNLLDKVKRKILLFDGDQTRFVYQPSTKSPIRVQGLSGTGKTELLLHKLKELYIANDQSKIAFTCHNRILADNLRKRIPDFFNFMKVEQQIKWNERLWCMHAWGSFGNKNSGTYRLICDHYGIPFNPWSRYMTFDRACKEALEHVLARPDRPKPFDFVLIDESQDFPQSFFDLCCASATATVYIAGDIFQSIFDENIVAEIGPDFLLSKCYRTDPRTLMFAHALGMGLFETKKLRWLDDAEWKSCGYIVEKDALGRTSRLKREPLRRFEDLEQEAFQSVEIVKAPGQFYPGAADTISALVQKIIADHPTVHADDIGIIFLDSGNGTYALADLLEQSVPRATGWAVNKAYETKQKVAGQLFVSNKNNVKGLEFPFVICVTEQITRSNSYRNALYMTMTRSFIKTYLVISASENQQVLPQLEAGLNGIIENGFMAVNEPTAEEQRLIRTTITYTEGQQSFFDFVSEIFDELDVNEIYRTALHDMLVRMGGQNFDRESVKETIEFNYRKMAGG